jgi:hypothetical protein
MHTSRAFDQQYVCDDSLYAMATNFTPLLADLFLYSYESEFLQNLVKDRKIYGARAFNFTYRYTDDVLSSLFLR